MQRSVAASLASILELDTADVPAPPADHPQPWTVWAQLARRGARSASILRSRRPATLGWPGPWLALLSARRPPGRPGRGRRVRGAARDLVHSPLGGPETFADVGGGLRRSRRRTSRCGRRSARARRRARAGGGEALAVAPDAEAPMVVVEGGPWRTPAGAWRATATAAGRGTFSKGLARGVRSHARRGRGTWTALELPSGPSRPRGRAAQRRHARHRPQRARGRAASGSVRSSASASACASRARTCAPDEEIRHPARARARVGLRADVLTRRARSASATKSQPADRRRRRELARPP